MSPPSLVLVAWLAYSDWVISPSLIADVLNAPLFLLPCYFAVLGIPLISCYYLGFGSLFATLLPSCYNIEIGHPAW